MTDKWRPCKGMAVSQAFIFHFKWYSLLHFAVCQLQCWLSGCMMWRMGLKRVWGYLETRTGFLLAPLCATIQIMDELCRRSCNFVNACLFSDCYWMSFVARQGIFYSRMASPLGRNAHFCCTRYGGRTQDISFIRNNYINYRVTSNLPEDILQTTGLLCQLCFFYVMFHLLLRRHVSRYRTIII